MKGLEFLELLEENFVSSNGETAQFNNFYKVFKKEMKQILKDEVKETTFSKEHFNISGFLKTNDDRIFYFSTGDVRLQFMSSMLIKTVKNYKDYVGGSNGYIPYNDNFSIMLKDFIEKR